MNIKWMVIIILSTSVLLGTVSTSADVLVSNTKMIEHKHKGGGSGMDTIRLVPPNGIKNSCAVFGKATVLYKTQRYGNVVISKNPKAKCNAKAGQCKLGVKWKLSPAGHVVYKVKVTWALKPC